MGLLELLGLPSVGKATATATTTATAMATATTDLPFPGPSAFAYRGEPRRAAGAWRRMKIMTIIFISASRPKEQPP
jgi:hypothetical protein